MKLHLLIIFLLFFNPLTTLAQQTEDQGREEISEAPTEDDTSSESDAVVDKSEDTFSEKTIPVENKRNSDEPSNSEDSQAENEDSDPKESQQFDVTWYQPVLGFSEKKQRTRVILTGKTQPGAKVYLGAKVIPVITQKRKARLFKASRSLLRDEKGKIITHAIANSDGLFQFPLDLPNYTAQVPLKVKGPTGGEPQVYQLNLSVSADKVKVTNQKNLQNSPLFYKKYGVWVGAGINYLTYNQKSKDISQSEKLESVKFPATYLKTWFRLGNEWDTTLEYKVSPGTIENSDTATFQNKNYAWTFYGVEFNYSPEEWNRLHLFGKWFSTLSITVGGQIHSLPFLQRVSTAGNVTTYKIIENNLNMLSLGFKLQAYSNYKWVYEAFLRRQLPLSAGSSFDASPTFTLDGSVGAYYRHKLNWRYGLFWYGQFQQHNYKSHFDTIENDNISGTQEILFSNIELRVGYEW